MFNLRQIEEKDLDFVITVRQDPEVQKYLGTLTHLNMFKQKKWYEKISEDSTKLYLIFEKTNFTEEEKRMVPLPDPYKKIGYVRLTEIDYLNKDICVGGDISKSYRGLGYGKEMYKEIFHLIFNQLNMNKCHLWVLENNERAIKLYKKLGFKESGIARKAIYKDGEYLDYIFMDLLKGESNVVF
jgi:RimJ/RimL family protein N-acetyltransferase